MYEEVKEKFTLLTYMSETVIPYKKKEKTIKVSKQIDCVRN